MPGQVHNMPPEIADALTQLLEAAEVAADEHHPLPGPAEGAQQ
jgi:hypothetical protein